MVNGIPRSSSAPTARDGADQRASATKQTKKGINAIDAGTAAADDRFLDQWVRDQVKSGNYPSKNGLKGQLPDMKETYEITQDRVAAAVERLLSEGRIEVEKTFKSPSGNVWLRPIDVFPQVLPVAGVP